MTSRYQGIKLGLDIYRMSIYHYYNIIVHPRNALIPDEGSIKVSNPDSYTASKPNLDTTQFLKYIFNDPLNLNPNTLSSIFCAKTIVHTRPCQGIVRRAHPVEFHAMRSTDLRNPFKNP